MLKTGVILAERYRLDEPIAAGGVGQVWRGTDLVLQRRVALKLLRPEYAEHPETLERFRAEARHAGSLTHPCIAQVHDYGDGGPATPPFLVMELVDGPSLADVLAAEPVGAAYALDVIAKAATGLAAAHRTGLVHRDLKPGNILLGPDGQVKISDFGIAHAAGSARLTDPGLVMGTTQYLAPERIAGTPASPGSDLYSMGIVLHECLTGEPPFEGTPAEVMAGHLYLPLPPPPANTPAEVEDLISRLTCKDPAGRLSDAADLATIARRLAAAIETGRASAPRQRQAPGISPVTGLPAAASVPPAAGSMPGSPGIPASSGPASAVPGSAVPGSGFPGSAVPGSAMAGSGSSALAEFPPLSGPGSLSGPSSGFALDIGYPYHGEFPSQGEFPAGGTAVLSGGFPRAAGIESLDVPRTGQRLTPVAETGAPGDTGTRAHEPGGRPARGIAGLLTGEGAARRRAAVASGLLLLAAAGVTGGLLAAGGGRQGTSGGHATQPAPLGVIQPSASSPSGGASTGRRSASAGKSRYTPHPGTTASGSAQSSSTPGNPAAGGPGSSPSGRASTSPGASPSSSSSSGAPTPSASPSCHGLLSCIGL